MATNLDQDATLLASAPDAAPEAAAANGAPPTPKPRGRTRRQAAAQDATQDASAATEPAQSAGQSNNGAMPATTGEGAAAMADEAPAAKKRRAAPRTRKAAAATTPGAGEAPEAAASQASQASQAPQASETPVGEPHGASAPAAQGGDAPATARPESDMTGMPGAGTGAGTGAGAVPGMGEWYPYQPGQQPTQQPPRREGDPRAQRPFGRGGQQQPETGAPAQPGRPYRTRFDRPAPNPNAPYGRNDGRNDGRNGGQGGQPGQGRAQPGGHGDPRAPRDQRDRRAGQPGHGQGGRPATPQRGQGGQGGAPGRNDRNDRARGQRDGQRDMGYGQGYVIPGYGVPGYGGQGYRDRGDRQRQGTQQRRVPVPPTPPVPIRTVEVQGVLWVRGNSAEVLDERGTLAQVATMNINDIRRMGLRPGDVIRGRAEEHGVRRQVVAVEAVNNGPVEQARERPVFESLTAISPRQRIVLERGRQPLSARIIDLFAPLGFGARALVVAPPKTGKTTFLRETAESVLTNYPNVLVMACLVGERPEEVTDLRTALEPRGGLVYAASFDEVQERHAWLVQVTIERAKRVAEAGNHVVVLLDSLTRLARAENLTGRAMGRTLSGGIDAQALDTGRRAFGAARCLEEGGSLTIMATCLVDTGSRQDDVVYEEFKGTGNMEIYLSRELSQRRLFPAVDAVKSGTRREELLLTPEELRAATSLRRWLADKPLQQATTSLLDALERTPSNEKLVQALNQSGTLR